MERDLQTILNESIKHCDFSIVYGHRDTRLQLELYNKGRTNGVVTNLEKVVTYCDGTEKKSQHNYYPSRAADCIPYPGGWQATQFDWGVMIGTILTTAARLYAEGKVTHELESGAFWKTFLDMPHFQLSKD